MAGRENESEITLDNGVEIGMQDTAIARVIFDQVVTKSKGVRYVFISDEWLGSIRFHWNVSSIEK